jgi:SAM-dependent methyltransferase
VVATGGIGEVYERSLSRAARRARGVFYTPPELVTRVVDETLANVLAHVTWRADGTPALRVLDPACGDGRFLVAALERIVAASAAREGAPGAAAVRAAVRAACVRRGVVVGVDRDPAAAALARTALGAGADVRVGEALTGGIVAAGGFDAIVGNPPYVRSVALRREDPELWRALRGQLHATSHGEWDLYAAFLERSLDWVAPGGAIGLVVPSRWLTSRAAARLRAHLHQRRAVRRIVDFGARQVFPGATNYTCLTFLAAGAPGAPGVEVSREHDERGLPERGVVAYECLEASAPWTLALGAAAAELERLRAAGPPLAAVARVAKGAGSNADPVFLVDADERAGCGEPVRIACVRGRDVGAYALAAARDALLPYDAEGALLAPAALARLAPSAAAHFERHRAVLEARERRRFAGDTFYRWGRPQNLTWLLDRAPKLIVPDAAAAGRAALDDRGRLVIDTAYAIRPLDARATPIGLLLAVLNSDVVALWLRATGIPLRGGYFRMKTAYLASLPVPDPSTRAARDLAADALVATPADAPELGRRVLALYLR